MNQLLAIASLLLFLAVPPIALWVRARRGPRFPWVAVVLTIAAFGWLSYNAYAYWHFEHLCEAVYGVEEPTEEALQRCTTDGAARTFALLFGWLFALLYASPLFAFYGGLAWLRARRREALDA